MTPLFKLLLAGLAAAAVVAWLFGSTVIGLCLALLVIGAAMFLAVPPPAGETSEVDADYDAAAPMRDQSPAERDAVARAQSAFIAAPFPPRKGREL